MSNETNSFFETAQEKAPALWELEEEIKKLSAPPTTARVNVWQAHIASPHLCVDSKH